MGFLSSAGTHAVANCTGILWEKRKKKGAKNGGGGGKAYKFLPGCKAVQNTGVALCKKKHRKDHKTADPSPESCATAYWIRKDENKESRGPSQKAKVAKKNLQNPLERHT